MSERSKERENEELARELATNLDRIGLSQYLDRFVEEGFDTWETILYIAESDLDVLNVRLGHRRRLQKEIAQARNISYDSLIPQIGPLVAPDVLWNGDPSRQPVLQAQDRSVPAVPQTTKRKYRRHPKPDENAPERPPSAYVIFSNAIREEIKEQKLSFTDIAKTVGERWQNLSPEDKKAFERRAASVKEDYNTKMAAYKRTDDYKDYQRYLEDFKAKNNTSTNDSKRTKTEKDMHIIRSGSVGSVSSSPSLPVASSVLGHGKRRDDSIGGYSHSPSGSVHASPGPMLSTMVSSRGEGEASPSASTPATPIAAPNHQLSRGGQGSLYQPTRMQSLPRLVPMEPPREDPMTSGHLPPINTDISHTPYNSRRTTNTTHATLLHHDTSKSSRSSDFSNTSSNSTVYTPNTPAEEHRSLHTAQPSSTLGGRFHAPIARAQPWPGSASGTSDPPHNREIPGQPFHQLSISESSSTDGTPSENVSTLEGPKARVHRHGSERSSGMDALSVLALAGHMVDQEQFSQPNPKIPP